MRRFYEYANRAPAEVAAIVIFCGAAFIRLLFVEYGLPYTYFWDETAVVTAARDMIIRGQLWPEDFYNYPSAVINLQAVTSVISYLYALGKSPVFLTFEQIPIRRFYVLGRTMMVAFSVASIVFTYRFAADVWKKPWWGVAAAALLAVSHHYITISRQIGVDVPMVALVMGGTYFLFRFGLTSSRRDFIVSAILWGAAAGTKYTAVLFALPIIVTLMAWRQPFRRFAAFGAIAAGTFLVLTPGVVFKMNEFLRDFAFEYHHYKVLGHNFLTSDQPLPKLTEFLLEYNFTLLPVVFLVVGIGVLAASRRKDWLLFLLFPVTFVIAIANLRIPSRRFVIDILPFLALLFCAGLGTVVEFLWRLKRKPLKTAAAVALVAVVFFGPARLAYEGMVAWSHTDQRTLAAEWIQENVPWPAVVVKEVWNGLEREKGGETDAAPIDPGKYEIVTVDWLTRKSAKHWLKGGAVYYSCHMRASRYPGRACFDRGALKGTHGDNAAFWGNFKLVKSFPPPRLAPYCEPMCIYRLRDNKLKKRHPYRRVLPLKECLVKKATCPHEVIKREKGSFCLPENSRLGVYFTAPARPYRIGLRCDGAPVKGVGPHLRVSVDGEEAADIHVTGPGVYYTPELAAPPPFYRHLLVEYYNDDTQEGDRNVTISGIFVEKAGKPAAGS
ncbi:MAG: glycosyltransferase family 39 protein [Candidatus Zixiibacteriota bacterium]|jgi:hypothetical protein